MEIKEQLGYLTSIRIELPYQPDPLSLYQRLCTNQPHNLLLDSAEIQSRQHLKSIILAQASLQFTCHQQQVVITALTPNGETLLPWLAARLTDVCELSQSPSQLVCQFAPATSALDEDSRLRSKGNMEPLRLVQLQLQQLGEQHAQGIFLGGIFGYDLIASFEDLPEVAAGENQCPDYQFYLAEALIIIDHQQQTTELLASLINGPDCANYYEDLVHQAGRIAAQCQLPRLQTPPSSKRSDVTNEVTVTPAADTFAQQVFELQDRILAGDIFQVVPSRTFKVACADSLNSYRQLKLSNPSPYMFFLRTADFEVFGASPESALKYTGSTNQVELYPIAGTRPRGKDQHGKIHPDLDSRLELELRLDTKELAEHMMLVDLARNDLARIARPGTRYVADLLQVDRYSHVMHLVSRVVAQLADDLDALDAYRACMNMGTLVGAPKISAARIIRECEQQRRGSYGGAVGYLSGNGDMDTCIVIRSAYVANGIALIQAGAGVVQDSLPSAEVEETENKAKAVIEAIIRANQQMIHSKLDEVTS